MKSLGLVTAPTSPNTGWQEQGVLPEPRVGGGWGGQQRPDGAEEALGFKVALGAKA